MDIKIFDISGKVLISSKIAANADLNINTQALAPGIYIARAIGADTNNASIKLYKGTR